MSILRLGAVAINTLTCPGLEDLILQDMACHYIYTDIQKINAIHPSLPAHARTLFLVESF